MIADCDAMKHEKSYHGNDDKHNDKIRYLSPAFSSSAAAVFHAPSVAFQLDLIIARFKTFHGVYLTY